jgi:hypothetical protein
MNFLLLSVLNSWIDFGQKWTNKGRINMWNLNEFLRVTDARGHNIYFLQNLRYVRTATDRRKVSRPRKRWTSKSHEDGRGLDCFVPKVIARRASEDELWKKMKARDIFIYQVKRTVATLLTACIKSASAFC